MRLIFLYYGMDNVYAKYAFNIESLDTPLMKLVSVVFYTIITFLLFTVLPIQGQAPIRIATNENVTVTLFFPSNVEKVIPPAVNFKFEYEPNSNMGLLKGRKGNTSNLTVITQDGLIFSFALKYDQDVEVFNYVLQPDQSIGNTKVVSRGNDSEAPKNERTPKKESTPEKETTTDATSAPNTAPTVNKPPAVLVQKGPVTDDPVIGDTLVGEDTSSNTNDTYIPKPVGGEGDMYDVDREEYYRLFCENNYLQKTIFKRSFRQNKKIVLKLNNILVDREDIYFVLQIENNSKKEYAVNGLSFFRESGIGDLQKILTPRYKFNLQQIIDPESINELVYVFKKFRISSKEQIHVVLDEVDDNRMVRLPLDYKHVNFPSN